MDELSCTNRLARRLALAAAICCAATSGYAGKPVSESGQTQSLGALLSQGWLDDKPAGDKVAKPIPIRALEKLAPTTSHPAAANKDAAA